MIHVYAIYLLRKLKNPFIAESALFFTFAIVLLFFVSVPSVMTNMASSGNFHQYLIMAFSTTEFLTQAILVSASVTMVLFLKNIVSHNVIRERISSVLSFLYAPFLVK